MEYREKATTRRALLAGCAGLLLVAGGLSGEAPGAMAKQRSELQGSQYGFLVDATRCVGCRKCIEACRFGNSLDGETADRRVLREYVVLGRKRTITTSCMHCAEPSCAKVCPAGAITKGAGGIVSVNKDRCIGCKYCYQACPYGVPKYNAVAMDKCDCCTGSGVAVGDEPFCARACKFGGLTYGLLDDLAAKARGRARAISDTNTPSCLVVF